MSAARRTSLVVVVLLVVSMLSPLMPTVGAATFKQEAVDNVLRWPTGEVTFKQEAIDNAWRWLTGKVSNLSRVIERAPMPRLWKINQLDAQVTAEINSPQEHDVRTNTAVSLLGGLTGFIVGTGITKVAFGPAGVLGGIIGAFIGYSLAPAAVASFGNFNSNYPAAARKAIEMGTQTAMCIYINYGDVSEVEGRIEEMADELDQAVNSYFAGNPTGKVMGFLHNTFQEPQFAEVKSHIVKVLELAEMITAVGTTSTSSPERQSGTGIYLGIPTRDQDADIYDTIDDEFEQLVIEENWPTSTIRVLTTAKSIIRFGDDVGVNTTSAKVDLYDAYTLAREGDYAGAVKAATDARTHVINLIILELKSKVETLKLAGAADSVIANMNTVIYNIENVLLPARDYPAFKEEVRLILEAFALEYDRLKLESSAQLDYVKSVKARVNELITLAEQEGINVTIFKDKIWKISDNLSTIERNVESKELVKAKAALLSVIDELRNLESDVRTSLRDKLSKKISIEKDIVIAVRNVGDVVYFRRTFILKNVAPVDARDIEKVLGRLPENVPSAVARDIKYTRMDVDIEFSDNGDIIAKISSAPKGSTAEINVWYHIKALSITSSWELRESYDGIVTIRYNINVKNISPVDIDNLPLEIRTVLASTVDVNAVTVVSGAAQDSGSFSDGNLIIRTSIYSGETKEIIVDLEVKAVDVRVNMLSDGTSVDYDTPLTIDSVVENVENAKSEYIKKPAEMIITNLAGIELTNVQILIPLFRDTLKIVLMSKTGVFVGVIEIPIGVPVTGVTYTLDVLPRAGKTLNLIYFVPNVKMWTAKKIKVLEENINTAKIKQKFAVDHGLTVVGVVNQYIQDAEAALSNAKTSYSDNRYDSAMEFVTSGLLKIQSAINELDRVINIFMTENQQASYAVEVATYHADKLENIINDSVTVVTQDKLDEYRKSLQDIRNSISAAITLIRNNNPTEAKKVADEANEQAKNKINELSAYVEQIVSFDEINARVTISELEGLINIGENYNISLMPVRNDYLVPAINRYEEAISLKENGLFGSAKLKFSEALQIAIDGLDAANTNINRQGKEVLYELKRKIDSLITKVAMTESAVEAYEKALGAEEDRTTYQQWKQSVIANKKDVNHYRLEVLSIENVAVAQNVYISVLIKNRERTPDIIRITSELDNIYRQANDIISYRRDQADNVIKRLDITMKEIHIYVEELRNRAREKVEKYENKYNALLLKQARVKEKFDEKRYTVANDLGEDLLADALILKNDLAYQIKAYPPSLPICAMTATLIGIIFVKPMIIFVARKRKAPGLKGTLRAPEREYIAG